MNKVLYTFMFLIGSIAFAQNVDHNPWNALLIKQVSNDGKVDYRGFKTDLKNLDNYLEAISNNNPEKFTSKNEKLAYWINIYNAFTIKLIVDNYPLKSIKDIKQPWDKKFIPIGDELLSLNYIEHEILRKMNEPRIHFAINCASKSCPKLYNKAFTPENLDETLTILTKEFLLDSTKNSISKNEIEISKIFKWFKKDFEKNETLIDFLNRYSKINISPNAKIKFKDYNWNLNE